MNSQNWLVESERTSGRREDKEKQCNSESRKSELTPAGEAVEVLEALNHIKALRGAQSGSRYGPVPFAPGKHPGVARGLERAETVAATNNFPSTKEPDAAVISLASSGRPLQSLVNSSSRIVLTLSTPSLAPQPTAHTVPPFPGATATRHRDDRKAPNRKKLSCPTKIPRAPRPPQEVGMLVFGCR